MVSLQLDSYLAVMVLFYGTPLLSQWIPAMLLAAWSAIVDAQTSSKQLNTVRIIMGLHTYPLMGEQFVELHSIHTRCCHGESRGTLS